MWAKKESKQAHPPMRWRAMVALSIIARYVIQNNESYSQSDCYPFQSNLDDPKTIKETKIVIKEAIERGWAGNNSMWCFGGKVCT